MNGGDEGSTLDFVKCGRGGDDGSACDAFTESDGSDQPPVLTALVSNAHTGSYKQIMLQDISALLAGNPGKSHLYT